MNILIPTKPDDIHAIYAQLGLAHYGHSALLWYTADFPIHQVHSLDLSHDRMTWYAHGTEFEVNNDVFDLIWFRRPRKPHLPAHLHPADKINAEKENAMFFQTLFQMIGKQAVWINPLAAARNANSKLLQLALAKKIGLRIPPTLISNDKQKVMEFINYYGNGDVIYKTLYPMVWLDGEETRLTYTHQLYLEDLPADEIFKLTPGIYQQRIHKAFELRVTFFSHLPVTVKIKSQEHPNGAMDWRAIPTKELSLEPFELPYMIQAQCRQLMRQLGLVFACFDFIVTKDNEYYFLELNESGQFLWIEEVNPDVKMLDIFTQFIMSKGDLRYWQKKSDSLSLISFKHAAMNISKNKLSLHHNPEM